MGRLKLNIKDDGGIEYYSIYSDSEGFVFFESRGDALCYMEKSNSRFSGGVRFHKEIDGNSVLPIGFMETEQAAFEKWLGDVCPYGDIEAVHRQWVASFEYMEFLDEILNSPNRKTPDQGV